MKKSIKGQLILLFILLGLAPLAVIFAIYSPSMLRDLTNQTIQGFAISSKSQVRLITLWIKKTVKETELLAASPQIISFLKSAQGELTGPVPEVQQFLTSHASDELIGAYLFDKKGECRASTGKDAKAVLPYLNKEGLMNTLQGRFSLYRLPAEKKFDRSLFISVPVFSLEEGKKEEVLGAMFVAIDLHQLQSTLENLAPSSTYSFLVDKQGNMITCIASKPDWVGFRTVGQKLVNPNTGLLTEGVKACLEGKEGNSPYAYTSHLGQKVFGAWGWIPGLETGVVIEASAKEIFLPVSAMRGQLWWLLLIVGAVITVVAIFTGSKISEPLISLAITAQKIVQGDPKERANIQSQNEIGAIAQCINFLADLLQKKTHPS
ncbi:MAG TPA: hypothetical protein ACFYD3_03000 [Candidatus Hypogeohydataceae bacterium YC41]